MLLLTLLACGSLNAARPLSPGEHAVGASLGGPVVNAGFARLPLPNLVVEGRSGLTTLADRPLELSYGTNVSGLVFGVTGLHVGAAWQAMDQRGAVPALALVERTYLYTNALDGRKDQHGSLLFFQLEALASWDSPHALGYVGLSDTLQPGYPRLLLTPVVGTELHLGERWGLQLEVRHYAITQDTDPLTTVRWVSWGPGAIGGDIGVTRRFGGER